MKTLILFLILGSLAYSAEDGGLTGEQSIAPPAAAQEAAIVIRDLNRQFGQSSATTLTTAVDKITAGATTAAAATINATAFWARLGIKGKRTLRWLTDLRDIATAAAPNGIDYIPAATRATLAKWTANPDNTVTVSP